MIIVMILCYQPGASVPTYMLLLDRIDNRDFVLFFCYRSCLTFLTMVGTESPSGHPLRMRPGPTDKQQSECLPSDLE